MNYIRVVIPVHLHAPYLYRTMAGGSAIAIRRPPNGASCAYHSPKGASAAVRRELAMDDPSFVSDGWSSSDMMQTWGCSKRPNLHRRLRYRCLNDLAQPWCELNPYSSQRGPQTGQSSSQIALTALHVWARLNISASDRRWRILKTR